MTEQEFQLPAVNTEVTLPIINVEGLAELKSKAIDLAAMIESVEPTEENMKKTKEMLAAVRKKTSAIASARKQIKDDILAVYAITEAEFKEIEDIIKGAETTQRAKIKAMDDKKAQEKLETICDLWDKHVSFYDFEDIISIDDFIIPKHFTKGMTINKIEAEMIAHLKSINDDIEIIGDMDDSEAILVKYFMYGRDITRAIRAFQLEKAQKEQAKEIFASPEPTPTPQPTPEPTALFEIVGAERIALVEAILTCEGIVYNRKVV